MGRRSRINYDNTTAFKQANLFETKSARRELAGLPSLERSYSGYDEIATRRTGPIGLDLEFNPTTNKATIMSVSSGDLIVATPFNREVLAGTIEACVKQGRKIVGHSVIGADRPVLKNMGIETELDDWRDTMLEHYVLSHDWTKNPAKKEDDEGALGFMGLWSMCSYYTDLWMWKECPGATCDGELCPTHDPEGYCGVDSWAGLKSHLEMQPRLAYWGVPEGFVKDIHELAFMCHTMQQRGVKVDYERVQVLQDDMEAKKALLFPETEHGYQWFNPKSPKQIQEWFLSRKIVLRDTDKESIKKVVQKKFKQLGIEQGEMPALEAVEDFRKNGGDAPEEIEVLARLYDLKNKGKGLKAWFDDKYRNRDKLIHPRFIVTGTCTGRLSSSRPNFQNISARGWGKLVKSCIVPRDPSLIFVESDFSQLELRVCLFLSGIDPAVIGADAFKWLVAKGNGAFEDAAKGSSLTGRDLAKISSHACLTGDHEVLTPEGWVKISEARDSRIAVWDKTGAIIFEKPQAYHEYANLSRLTKVSGTSLETLCTDNHEFPIVSRGSWRGKKYKTVRRVRSADFTDGSIPTSGVLADPWEEKYSDLEIMQAVAVQADGSFVEDGARFHIVKKRKKDRLRKLWPDAIESACTCTHKGGPGSHFRIKFKSDLLDENKNFTANLLKLSNRQREIFLAELLKWDGSCSEDGRNAQYYFNKKLESCQWVQTIAHLSGRQALIRESSDGCYKVSLNSRSYASVDRLKREVVPVSGERVYCFTTSTGFFLVRYKNKVHVTGNSNYMEGLVLLSGADLNRSGTKSAIAAGALFVYNRKINPAAPFDWDYCGKVVAFTGANLAERLYRDKSFASRKKALDIQEGIYFKNFPDIRRWQKETLTYIQDHRHIKSPIGRFLRLYGTPEDNAKTGVAFLGQGVGADHVQGIMMLLNRGDGRIPLLQVHDSLVYEIPREWGENHKQIREWMQPMYGETWRLTGFSCPGKIKVGRNYGERFDDKKVEINPGGLEEI